MSPPQSLPLGAPHRVTKAAPASIAEVLTYMIVWSCIDGITGVLGIVAAMMSPMLFDAPGSERLPSLRRFFWCVVSYPLVCAFGLCAGWLLYAYADALSGAMAVSLPGLHLLAGIVLFARLPDKFHSSE